VTAQHAPRGARTREPELRTLVFVYGTLLVGQPNHRYLKGAQLLREARTLPQFLLYDLGPFPGLVRGGEYAIVGEVHQVDEPTLAMLDRLEGHPRFYRRTSIVLADGTQVETYLLTPEQVAGRPIIASGSWRARHSEETP
jgi:gamma-glutamylaminecyclotransferase